MILSFTGERSSFGSSFAGTMRKLILMCVGLALVLPAWGQDEDKDGNEDKLRTGVVHIQQLFKSYYKVTRAQEEINMERARIQKEHNKLAGRVRSMDQGLRELTARLQSTELGVRDRASLEREKGLRSQERDMLDHERRAKALARHTELNQKMVARMEALLDEIREVVADQAARTGYDLVFDVEGLNTSQVPMVLFAKDATDITPMILKELNKSAPSRG